MEYTLRQMEKELVYYLDYAIEHRKSDNIDQILIYIERKVNHYRKGFLEFIQYNERTETRVLDKESLKRILEWYNWSIQSFSEFIEEYHIGKFSCESLQIHDLEDKGDERWHN